MGFLIRLAEVWTVQPESPRVVRWCPRCCEKARFVSSGRFRVNAQGRRLDVWLIYKCERCEETWKLEVLARVSPEEIPEARYLAFLQNDSAEAQRVASNAALLQRAGVSVVSGGEFSLQRPPVVAGRAVSVVLRCPAPQGPRLDTLLARGLGVPRSLPARWLAAGWLESQRPLHRAVCDGQQFALSAEACALQEPAEP
jgi:hypothetical protein